MTAPIPPFPVAALVGIQQAGLIRCVQCCLWTDDCDPMDFGPYEGQWICANCWHKTPVPEEEP